MANDTLIDKPLTRRMQQFCEEYLVDLSRSRAAERAGYSARSARQLGHMLFKDARIQVRIAELMREREQATRIKGYKVLEELAAVALSSLEHFTLDDEGRVTVAADAPPGAMRAVAKYRRKVRVVELERIEHTTRRVVEYETEFALWDKNTALTNAMKHLGLLKDVVEHRDLTLEDIIRAAADRGDAPPDPSADAGNGDAST